MSRIYRKWCVKVEFDENVTNITELIEQREDRDRIVVEVLPLTNYVKSAEEHQHHLERFPGDCTLCSIPDEILNKYRNR